MFCNCIFLLLSSIYWECSYEGFVKPLCNTYKFGGKGVKKLHHSHKDYVVTFLGYTAGKHCISVAYYC